MCACGVYVGGYAFVGGGEGGRRSRSASCLKGRTYLGARLRRTGGGEEGDVVGREEEQG